MHARFCCVVRYHISRLISCSYFFPIISVRSVAEFNNASAFLKGYSINTDARLTFSELDVGVRISCNADDHDFMAIIVGFRAECVDADPSCWGYYLLLDSGELKWFAFDVFVFCLKNVLLELIGVSDYRLSFGILPAMPP